MSKGSFSFDFTTSHDHTRLVIKGIEANNIKNLDLELPHGKIIALTGVSGAGKSTISNIIYRYNSEPYNTTGLYNSSIVLHNSKINSIVGIRPSILMHQKHMRFKNKSTVGTMTGISKYLRYIFSLYGVSIPYSPKTGKKMEKTPVNILLANIVNSFNYPGYYLSIVFQFYIESYEIIKKMVYLIDVKYIELYNVKYLSAAELEESFVAGIYTICVMNVKVENLMISSIEEKLKDSEILKDQLNIVDIKPYVRVNDANDMIVNEQFITNSFYCQESNIVIDKISSKLFSFNTPEGGCKACLGMGYEKFIDIAKVIPDTKKSINEGGVLIWKSLTKNIRMVCNALAERYNFTLDAPIESFNKEVMDILLYGVNHAIQIKSEKRFAVSNQNIIFNGIINILKDKMKNSSTQVKNSIDRFLSYRECHDCKGHRLSKASLCFKVAGKNIGEVNSLNLVALEKWLRDLLDQYMKSRYENILSDLINPILKRIISLKEIGLSYLSLDRLGNTLSGGEVQRLRLAEQLQHKLTGVIFVLDEPSSGLHGIDQAKVINVIKYLQKLNNTIILVEHNLSFIKIASHILDIGPKAGIFGGKIVAQGTVDEVSNVEDSITGQYLSGRRYIEYNDKKEISFDQCIHLQNAHSNNLKNIDLRIPLGKCTIVSGPSGCGKTSLIMNTLYKGLMKEVHDVYLPDIGKYDYLFVPSHIKGVMHIDQKPIGKTSRSNLSTYMGIFDMIRDVFAAQPLAKQRKFTSSHFSFNIKDGSCLLCLGAGILRNEMSYSFNTHVVCEECHGKRYKQEVLDVQYKGKSIASVLNMSVDEAYNFFKENSGIFELLDLLKRIGLGYLKLGHSAMDFSGGETQRIKICKELSKFLLNNSKVFGKNNLPHVVYIIDELNVGLHIYDTQKVLLMVKELTKNNTVVIIDHNIDSIKKGDYIIDMGPGSSEEGGRIIAQGSPLELINNPDSITGPYLKARIEEDDMHHKKHGRK